MKNFYLVLKPIYPQHLMEVLEVLEAVAVQEILEEVDALEEVFPCVLL